MGLGVHEDGDGLILRRDQGYLVAQAPFHNVLPLIHQDRIGILEPYLYGSFDGVVATAQKVVEYFLVHRLLAAIRHFPTLGPHVELHHIAVLGNLDAIVVGPLMVLKIFGGAGVGIAVKEGGDGPLPHLVLHVEPGLAAQSLHHGIELCARLLRVLCCCVVACLRRGCHRPCQH